MSVSLWSQAPQAFTYQAVIRNATGNIMKNQAVGIQVSLIQGSPGGASLYVERFSVVSNDLGLISIEIGKGDVQSGVFEDLDWSAGPYFLKIELDEAGGTNYTTLGISQLLSVPYALYAGKAGDAFSGNYGDLNGAPTVVSAFTNDAGYLSTVSETDPVFNASPAKTITAADMENWNNKLSVEEDGSVTNELQVLSLVHDTLYLSNGGFVKFPGFIKGVYIQNDSLYVVSQEGLVSNEGYVGRGAPGTTLATVVTDSIYEMKYTQAKVAANVLSQGGEFVMSRGVCLSLTPTPTLDNLCIPAGTGTGPFSLTATGLQPGTIYYARSFASNAIGTSYGNELSFSTLPQTTPSIETLPVYNISLSSAMSGGNITDDGGMPVLERGICWALNTGPTTSDFTDPQGGDPGSFNALMNGLSSGTTYYVRAYATNALGTAYGEELVFTTNSLALASVTTGSVSNISFTSAMAGGTVVSDNGYPVSTRGICWATTPAPTTAGSKYTESGAVGSFTATITGLLPANLYYVRAFAVNDAGTSYGEEVQFTTLTTTAPVLTTKAITGVSSNIASSGGDITSDGGSPITAKGVCWNVNPGPTLAHFKTQDGTGSASYNSTLTGLSPLSTYYVRAYAINAIDTAYGNELSFTSTDLVYPPVSTVPIVATASSVLVNSSTASTGGYVSTDGGSPILGRGVVWGTTANPTLAGGNYTEDGTGLGYFSSVVTGLTGCNVTHYIRAYAYNSTDTAYGAQNSVLTGNLPSGLSTIINQVKPDSIIAGGNIPDDGGCPITQRGVCWGLTANPVASGSHTSDGTGSGSFVSVIPGLLPNVTYYIRAYAVNSKGTVYGDQQVVTTTIPSGIYLGQSYAGGKVFYIDASGEHGLVCSPISIGNFPWGCSGTGIATSVDFGAGESNTAAILAFCAESNIAARACDTLNLNGYSDWFLPSINELNLVYNNIGKHGVVPNISYWSSSQCNEGYAYYSVSGYGNCGCTTGWFPTCYGAKTTVYAVLAVRRF